MRQCSTGSGRLHHGQLWRRRLAAGYRVDSCGRAQWVPLYCMMNTLRDEGIAVRYLEINGVWEDHVRYGLTIEEWEEQRDKWLRDWVE